MAVTWRKDSDGDGSTAVLEGGGWDGSDVDVGHVSRSLRPPPEPSGWRARYWGKDDSRRYHVGTGSDPATVDNPDVVGGLWATADLAKEAVEEAHAGPSACE